jgi:DNA sulfur modification protein DndD
VILSKISINNFQIFYGQQTVDLVKGLYVLHGENGRGKSTFLNAVTWALFGEYLNRQGDPVTPNVMLNRDARDEGFTKFSVELLLEDSGDKIRVNRTYETQNQAVGVQLTVEKNGSMLNQQDGEELLRRIVDREVSRFFLFDGEELRRYEELLSTQTATEVRRSIEHILGLPTLTNAIADLRAVAETFESEATKAARREKGAKQAALKAEQLETDVKGAQDNLKALQTQKADFDHQVLEANAVLQENQASEELLRKKEGVESKIEALREGRKDKEANRQEALRSAWLDVLAVAVKPRVEELASSLADEQQRELWKSKADEIEAALAGHRCDTCEQELHGDAETKMRERLTELRNKPQPSGSFADLGQKIGKLAAIQATGQVAQAINHDKSIGKDNAKLAQLEQELHDLQQQSQGIPEEELRQAAKKRDNAQQMIGVTNTKIEDATTKLDKAKTDLATARKEAQNAATSKEAATLSKRAKMANDLANVFEQAKDDFRDAMRAKVGTDASALFLKLTAEKAFKGLEISEGYGLATLGPDGKPIPGTSAGQEQIIAFSLIGALSQNATRRPPIIMDTPLGRLGAKHKTNVMKHLTDFGDQVILLVHDDEVSDEILNSVRSDIVAEFELARDDLFRTSIRKRVAT